MTEQSETPPDGPFQARDLRGIPLKEISVVTDTCNPGFFYLRNWHLEAVKDSNWEARP